MTNIFVGNLPYDATAADLRSVFERYGYISDIQVVTDRATGKPRGFAFIRMPNLEDAEEAIARLNGSRLRGRPLSVNEANSRERDSSPSRVPKLPRERNILELI